MSGVVRLADGELLIDPDSVPTAEAGPAIRRCGDGPWLVRSADHVETEDGDRHATTRPVVAVCACAHTQRAPWCDGTHKVLRPR